MSYIPIAIVVDHLSRAPQEVRRRHRRGRRSTTARTTRNRSVPRADS
jgi:hypothetical protein